MADPLRFPVPPRFGEMAQSFARSGATAAVPRVAATVILLRPLAGGFEVYALRRAATMAFAAGMYAFPGGSVDARDAGADLGWTGPPPAWWARRLGLDEAGAEAVVCAAVREVFEECGVLLAGPDESTVVGDVSGADWEAARLALLAREVALSELLAQRGLVLRSDLLAPWSRWLTPVFEPRRFDTYFFLARLPTDQVARDVGGEAEHTLWGSPEQIAGLPMLPPTLQTLRELSDCRDVDAAMASAAGRELTTPRQPFVEFAEDGVWLVVS
jgi:8-oxo-dGTP pyrophosphatase MutT (NUDIX family)